MKKVFRLLAFVFFSSMAFGVTCHAVSPSGSGAATGADWNNALAGIPGSFTRGHIYYLADGNYGNISVSTAASGTLTVEFRKAQSFDNGSSCSPSIAAGWNTATMGSAQAHIIGTGSTTTVPYVLLNGNGTSTDPGCGGAYKSSITVTQAVPNPTDCGIMLDNSGGQMTGNGVLWYINGTQDSTLEYVEVYGSGVNATVHELFGGSGSSGHPDTYSHMYLHNSGCVFMQDLGNFSVVDHSYFWGTEVNGETGCHGQAEFEVGPTSNGTRTNDVYRDITGTAIWTFAASTGTGTTWLWYNNIVYWSPYGQVTTTNGTSGSCPSNCVTSTGGDNIGQSFTSGQTIYLGNTPGGSAAFTVGTVYSNTLVSVTSPPGAHSENFYTVQFGGISDAVWDCINSNICNNWTLVQNTIVNCHSGAVYGNGCGVEYDGNTSCTPLGSCGNGSFTAENNLWYNTTGATGWLTGNNSEFTATTDFNSFLNTPSFSCGTNGTCSGNTSNVQVTSGAPNPFVAWPSNAANFSLASDNADWNNRTSGGLIPTVDIAGNTFTTDRGAYQFVSGAPILDMSFTGLTMKGMTVTH